MCELLGLTSLQRINVNSYLSEFYSHSFRHCHGWGQALFQGTSVSVEKEAVCANQSLYLRQRLAHPIAADNMIAHIRLASVGRMFYENCHPFSAQDSKGRAWVLAHNGTLFHEPDAQDFKSIQEGQTDSERILCRLLRMVNLQQERQHRALSATQRFSITEKLVKTLSPSNKLNLLIWDGESLYVHTNYRGTLYMCHLSPDTILFSTQPLQAATGWEPVPFCQLLSFKQGHPVHQGSLKTTEYSDQNDGHEYKNIDFAGL